MILSFVDIYKWKLSEKIFFWAETDKMNATFIF